MPPAPPTMTFQQLMVRLIETLHVNSTELARLFGVSPRTITRYWKGGGSLLPSKAAELARKAHPHDRALAVELAARAGATLVDLGLEAPPAPAVAPPPRTPPALHRHAVDAVVGVAAEALGSPPQAVRAGVVAAFERAVALGMTAEEVLAAMAPLPSPAGPAPAAAKATRAAAKA